MKLFHTFIQQAAYEILAENRREALRRSGSMVLHGDEGRMTAEEIAEAINKNPNYGWHYHPLTADGGREDRQAFCVVPIILPGADKIWGIL